MHRKYSVLITSLGLLQATASFAAAPDSRQVLSEVSTALGADSLKSIEFSASGSDFAIGQAYTVNSPWPKFNDKSYTRVVSFDPWATSLQRVRTQAENPPRGGGGQPISGEQKQSQSVAAGSPAAKTLPDELALLVPQAFVKAAAAAPDLSASNASKNGKTYTVLAYTAGNKAKTRGWINAQHQLERVETAIDNPVLGDTKVETQFGSYKSFGGVNFPTHIAQQQGGYPVLDLTVADVKANVPVDIQPSNPPTPVALASEQLGPGVYLISGGYAAVAVAFKDHITVIEGGQNDQRSEAVIAEVKRLIPGKPITELVNTHAHFDHLGGVRAYVAEGATIITHKNNEAYFKKVWANPHTLVPDRLATNPKSPKFKLVDDKLTLTDGEQVVELYRLHDIGHHEGLLFAYLPKHKVLVEADAFNPPAAPLTKTPDVVSPYPQSLVANIDRLKLDVQRIVPVHLPADNRKITVAELHLAAGG